MKVLPFFVGGKLGGGLDGLIREPRQALPSTIPQVTCESTALLLQGFNLNAARSRNFFATLRYFASVLRRKGVKEALFFF